MRFGGIVALDGVSFDVEQGHISGLIGPNGAGKTTAFNVITRLYKPDTGDVLLDGSSLLKQPAFKIVRKGVARTFQNIQLFRTMSVLDNVLIGAHGRGRSAGQKEALEVLDVSASAARSSRQRHCHTGSRSASSSHAPWWRSRASSCWTSQPAG